MRYFSDIKRIFGKVLSFSFPAGLPSDKTVPGAFVKCALTVHLFLVGLAIFFAIVLFWSPAASATFLMIAMMHCVCFFFIPLRYGYLKGVTEGSGGNPTPNLGSFPRNAALWSPILIIPLIYVSIPMYMGAVSYTHLRAHET